jgi:hypothetical protein
MRFSIVLGNSAGPLDETIIDPGDDAMGVTKAVISFIADTPLADGDIITVREIEE